MQQFAMFFQMSTASNAGVGYGQLVANSYEVVSSASNDLGGSLPASTKRKRRDSSLGGHGDAKNASVTRSASPPPAKKKKRTSSSSSPALAGLAKKNAVYCVCKTKYDPTK
jgi:hypothetical protein